MWVKISFVATCPTLSLSNGDIDYAGDQADDLYLENTVATFMCNSGYSLFGAPSLTRETSRNWSDQAPTCRGNEVQY